MGRSGSAVLAFLLVIFLAAGFSGCGSSPAATSSTYPVPGIITLTPTGTTSLEIGQTASFSATAETRTGSTISEPLQFQSSNTAILTISSSGVACAGSWDSTSNPTVCTPGPAGVVQVWATAKGVSSPPTTVYVHQHIDNILASRITDSTTPNTPCLSVGQTANYQATAYNQGMDITSTVGIFTWVATSTVVTTNTATATNQISGLNPGQMQATAKVPGTGSIYAIIGNATSLPIGFTVCPVQSITLLANGTNQTSVTVSSGTGVTLKPTILDTLGNTITGSFLSWSSSNSAAVTVSTAGGITTPLTGGASISASCTPPTCNVGITPTLPVYAPSDVYVKVSPSTTTTTTPSSTVWVGSTGCGAADGCISTLVPVTVPNYTVGNAVGLPATPNSFIFSPDGSRAFLGTDSGDFGTKGLMVMVPGNPSSVYEYVSAPGKVLAVSDDGTKLVVSDTADTPNQVFIVTCGGTGACSSENQVALNITGATAARFSPDGLKAFIAANNGASSTLYVYSALDTLETIPLSTSANAHDLAFLGNGAFGYIAGGTASGVSVLATCHNPANPAVATVSTPGTPLMIHALPDGKMLALDPPDVDLITSTVSGTGCTYSRPYPGASGAPFIPGTLAVSNSVTSVNLGQGVFTPLQFMVSGDANTAYVIAKNLPSVLLYDIPNQLVSGIQLVGNATPLDASLAVDGTQLYVGASDGAVHVLDTVLDNDIQQVSFPTNLCLQLSTPCLPDLVAVKP
jgi:hypothetical protein